MIILHFPQASKKKWKEFKNTCIIHSHKYQGLAVRNSKQKSENLGSSICGSTPHIRSILSSSSAAEY